MKYCGFVSLIGAPNAGKSTLLNALLGTKISIVCHKQQTTRTRVVGILTHEETQAVLVDTPGIFQNPKQRLEKSMISSAWQAVRDADLILLIVDASRTHMEDEEKKILEALKSKKKEAILVLNKVDLVPDKTKLLEKTKIFSEAGGFDRVFMISAKSGQGLLELKDYIFAQMPESEWFYPADQVSDMPQRLLTEELTREVLLHEVHAEVPYGLTVRTDLWEKFNNGSLKIVQTICVEREAHKPILVGKGGQKIKRIGEQARKEISRALGVKVHLMLHVKVDEKWKDRPESYQDLGLDFTS